MKTSTTIAAALLILSAGSAQATVISFSDATGDHTGAVDVTGMTLDINDVSGDYTIDITADAANPFTGDFRVNINLFNATLDEFFQNVFNDFALGGATQTLVTLTGTDTDLTDWLPTHDIATSTLAGLGNPPGSTFFRSSVADLPFGPTCTAEDIIGITGCTPPARVPEPGALSMFLLALAGIAAYGLKRVG